MLEWVFRTKEIQTLQYLLFYLLFYKTPFYPKRQAIQSKRLAVKGFDNDTCAAELNLYQVTQKASATQLYE